MSRQRHRQTLASLDMARISRDGVAGLVTGDLRALVGALADRLDVPPIVRDEAIKVAGLQDLGLLGVSRSTLSATHRLDDDERAELRNAPVVAQGLVAAMPGYETIADEVRHVQERWDGKGFPDGLAGTEIPLASRLVAVAAAFQAMSTPRPFRAAMHPRAILGELEAGSGTQFDPQIVSAMLAVAGERSVAK